MENVKYTYSGAGRTLAPRIMEYGTIIIGFVGRAKNGCDELIASGVLELSSLVFGYEVFGVKGFAVVGMGGPGLNDNKEIIIIVNNTFRKGRKIGY